VENLRWNKLGIAALQNKHGLCIFKATDSTWGAGVAQSV
jgi:hypothetical protein